MFGRAHCFQSISRISQGWPEAANTEMGEVRPYSVHNTRAFLDEAFTLTARPPRVFILKRGE